MVYEKSLFDQKPGVGEAVNRGGLPRSVFLDLFLRTTALLVRTTALIERRLDRPLQPVLIVIM